MTSLPTLRRKILRSFSVIVFLYAGLGVFIMFSVFLASSTTPKMLHINYDSIAASNQMREAWTSLDNLSRFPSHPAQYWMDQFSKALSFEEGNITEPGEAGIVIEIKKNWEAYKKSKISSTPISVVDFERMNRQFTNLTQINEKGMFDLTEQNVKLRRKILLWAVLYFLVTLIFSFILADNLASRLSQPLKSIAEALQQRPNLKKRLKLIEPKSLELFILCNELKRLWDQVVESQRVNVDEVIQEKQKLETVLEAVEDGLLVINGSGKVAHCNPFLLSLLELDSSQVKGQRWDDLPTACENYMKLRSILQPEMQSPTDIELTIKSARRYFSTRSRKIIARAGGEIGVLFFLNDITEKRQRDRFRSDFIDLLSHEIKTPLQSLGTATEFLTSQKNNLPELVKPFVETISEDVERIRAVANEFVQVTQSQSKIMKLRLDLVELNQVLPEWIKPFRVIAKDREVDLEFVKEGSEIIMANLDPVKFPWVISNLLSNAIRFSPVGGKVQVCLTDRNGFVEIKVKDQGPGVTEEDQRRMFEPFYQSPMTTTSGRKGLFGIGLTITKEVVEAHEGRIEYNSRVPSGSEFRILLPFVSA